MGSIRITEGMRYFFRFSIKCGSEGESRIAFSLSLSQTCILTIFKYAYDEKGNEERKNKEKRRGRQPGILGEEWEGSRSMHRYICRREKGEKNCKS